MTAENRFKSALINWLCQNHMPNIDIDFKYDFGYVMDDELGIHKINIGVAANDNACCYFEQFLYEYGCEYCGIPYPILAFLHECGHVNTVSQFTDIELKFFELMKQFNDEEDEQIWFNEYWQVPDEFAANMWVVDFINNHIDIIENLCDTFINAWIELHKSVHTMFDLIKEEE